MNNTKHKAFTILELTISLSIIAFIIGTATAGIYIKRKSELNSIMDQVSKLESAYNNFKIIYNALPGDLYAFSQPVFGPYNAKITGINILYGNGNGIIDNSTIPDPNGGGTIAEGFVALQHLAFANLIFGLYSGIPSASSTSPNNAYVSSLNNRYGYYFGSNSNIAGSNFTVFDSNSNDKRSSMIIYATIGANTSNPTVSALSPSDMYKLDIKYDDGLPVTGWVLGANGSDNTSACINNNNSPNIYNISSTLGCYMGVILDKKFQ